MRMGYTSVSSVGGPGGRAVDVIAHKKDEFGRVIRYALPCKRYDPSSKVGSKDMQVFCAMISKVHGSDRGIFVATSSFTEEAVEIPRSFGVTLGEGRLIAEPVERYGWLDC